MLVRAYGDSVRMMILRTLLCPVCLLLISAGCATHRVPPGDACAGSLCTERLFLRTEYTAKGLPVFLSPVDERPKGEGARFTLVQMSGDKPVRSYDIVVGEGSDFSKPFKVVYEWTGRGFIGGARMVPDSLNAAVHVNPRSGEEAGMVLAFSAAPVVIGTAGGFIVGVADGIRTTAVEMGKAIAGKQERVATYTTYEYDSLGRLAATHLYDAGGKPRELVRTEYTYDADSTEPQKAVITTLSDGAVRVVE
jgi:YD repeat-containing protein